LNKKKYLFNLLVLILFGSITALAFWNMNPGVLSVPGTDSGVYLYAGRQILEGKIPYLDFGSNKGPLFLFIQVISLLISNNSWWGICILQLIWLSITAFLCYYLLRKSIGIIPAFSISIGVIFSFYHVAQDNFPETYSVLFAFIALICFMKMRAQKKSGGWGFLMGLAFAGSFMIRPNLVATWAAIGLFYIGDWILFPKKYSIQYFIPPILGAVLGVLVCLSPTIVNGAFGYFWDGVFNFNFSFAADRMIVSRFDTFIYVVSRLQALYRFIAMIPLAVLLLGVYYILEKSKTRSLILNLFGKCFYFFVLISIVLIIRSMIYLKWSNILLAMTGIFLFSLSIIARSRSIKTFPSMTDQKKKPEFQINDVEVVAGISLLLEVIVLVLVGKDFDHYFAIVIPSLSVLFGAAIRALSPQISRIFIYKISFNTILIASLILVFVMFPIFGIINSIRAGTKIDFNKRVMQNIRANEYLLAHTAKTDLVLFWGRELTNVNFSSRRNAPGIASSVIGLYVKGYCNQEIVSALIEEYTKHAPDLIIDSKYSDSRISYILALPSQMDQYDPEILKDPCLMYLKPLFEFIDQNYALSDVIEPNEWNVYTKKN
jgi:4-amino-4-deoxy-L-arabinose transferase-like glycosyltransferase